MWLYKGFFPPHTTTLLKSVILVVCRAFLLAKESVVKLISTPKCRICQVHAESCLIWRFCIYAEECCVVLKGYSWK